MSQRGTRGALDPAAAGLGKLLGRRSTLGPPDRRSETLDVDNLLGGLLRRGHGGLVDLDHDCTDSTMSSTKCVLVRGWNIICEQ